MRKVKAFTVLEIAIAMVITAVVITIAYNSLYMFHSVIKRYKSSNEQVLEIAAMIRTMKRDHFLCDKVLRNSNGFICIFEDREVAYEFYSEHVIRRSTEADTFYVPVAGTEMLLRGELAMHSGLVDVCHILIGTEESSHKASLMKKYAADMLINEKELK